MKRGTGCLRKRSGVRNSGCSRRSSTYASHSSRHHQAPGLRAARKVNSNTPACERSSGCASPGRWSRTWSCGWRACAHAASATPDGTNTQKQRIRRRLSSVEAKAVKRAQTAHLGEVLRKQQLHILPRRQPEQSRLVLFLRGRRTRANALRKHCDLELRFAVRRARSGHNNSRNAQRRKHTPEQSTNLIHPLSNPDTYQARLVRRIAKEAS